MIPTTSPVVTICAWCDDFDPQAAANVGASHTICARCQDRLEQDGKDARMTAAIAAFRRRTATLTPFPKDCPTCDGYAVEHHHCPRTRIAGVALLLLAAVVGLVGCGSTPTGPTAVARAPIQVQADLDYTIHVPDRLVAQQLQTAHPTGVRVNPITAQLTWDYRPEYGGSAHVYYGPLPGAPNQYPGTGIVIAPVAVASQDTFTAADWPAIGLDPHTTYTWVGRFEFTAYGGGQ